MTFVHNESLVTIQSADGKQNGQKGVAMSLCEEGYSTLKTFKNFVHLHCDYLIIIEALQFMCVCVCVSKVSEWADQSNPVLCIILWQCCITTIATIYSTALYAFARGRQWHAALVLVTNNLLILSKNTLVLSH